MYPIGPTKLSESDLACDSRHENFTLLSVGGLLHGGEVAWTTCQHSRIRRVQDEKVVWPFPKPVSQGGRHSVDNMFLGMQGILRFDEPLSSHKW